MIQASNLLRKITVQLKSRDCPYKDNNRFIVQSVKV